MATALYRRYRPESFSEMIGQAHVTEPLMTALRTGRVGHAYLFSGPRGCGKTTSARILARCLNCVQGPTDTPCGECPSCIELSRDGGGSLDVVEIDAASHGGVDDARDLRERAVFAPARDRYKIFIIDEAHMVTSGGFNALLKIVEEPPPHVKFIFATTEPEKVIGTIRSRTHHYPFRLIAPGALIDYSQQLAENEQVSIEPGVMPLVVRAGGGSVRDTLSILDQLIAGSESDTVTLARATGLLGYTSTELLDAVVDAFGSRDAAAAFTATDRVVQTGQDPRRFVEDLLERLRDLIVVSATTVQGAASVFRGVPADQLQRMFEQSRAFTHAELSTLADTVSASLDGMTGATSPRLQLELMVARAIVALGTAPASPRGAAPASGAVAATGVAAASEPVAPAAPAAVPEAPAPAAPLSAHPAPAPAAPASAPAAVDIVSTLRSAREFLRNDTAGAAASPAPASTPSAPSVHTPVPQAAEAPVPDAQLASAQGAPAIEAVGIGELLDVWPDLLDELLEEDRAAWNAVKVVQPLAIEDDVLSIGLASQSDLDAFKAAGAGPLREAIFAAVGIRVKYAPKQMPAGVHQAAARESAADAEPSLPAEPRTSAGDDPPTPAQVVETTATSRPVDDPYAGLDPDATTSAEDDSDPYAEAGEQRTPRESARSASMPGPQPAAVPESAVVPESALVPESTAAPKHTPRVSFSEALAAAAEVHAAESESAAPVSSRYGEAVVRELLGARFIEELPLPQPVQHLQQDRE